MIQLLLNRHRLSKIDLNTSKRVEKGVCFITKFILIYMRVGVFSPYRLNMFSYLNFNCLMYCAIVHWLFGFVHYFWRICLAKSVARTIIIQDYANLRLMLSQNRIMNLISESVTYFNSIQNYVHVKTCLCR